MTLIFQIKPNALIMKKTTAIIFLFLVVVSIHALKQPKIYGGSQAAEGKFPYHVSLQRFSHFCGGSIINKRWILTAAHCLRDKNVRTVKVVVGTTSVLRGNGTVYQAEKLISHEENNKITKKSDIALVRVNKDIEFNNNVQPIKLATKNTIIYVNENVFHAGWGVHNASNTLSETLKYIKLKVSELRKCNKPYYKAVVGETQICVISKKDEGFCSGDSGGVLVNEYGIQIGISSFFRAGCGSGHPQIFTRVSSYRDWIHEKIG